MEKVPTKGRERELTGGPETVLTIAMEEVLTLPMENLLDIHTSDSMQPPEGVPPEAAGIAAKANMRLHSRALHLRRRGKKACVANIAVARELAGFVWALALCG